MATPHSCPVCGGCGTVEPAFYDHMLTRSDTARPTCRSCGGGGIVWEHAPFVCPSVFSIDPPLKPGKWTVRYYDTGDDPRWWYNTNHGMNLTIHIDGNKVTGKVTEEHSLRHRIDNADEFEMT